MENKTSNMTQDPCALLFPKDLLYKLALASRILFLLSRNGNRHDPSCVNLMSVDNGIENTLNSSPTNEMEPMMESLNASKNYTPPYLTGGIVSDSFPCPFYE